MKSGLLFVLFASILLLSINGQNYQSVTSDRIAYFKNDAGNIRSLRIDSSGFISDSVLYPFTIMQGVSDNCVSPFVASWIGPSVIIKPNGLNLFINHEGDTITINTLASVGDKWIAYQQDSSIIVEASVVSCELQNFLGLQDSVKTIAFTPYNEELGPLDLPLSIMTVKLSKNYGFVRALNFYIFPGTEVLLYGDEFEELDLIGLSNPQVGVQNLTWFEVYDFQPGDEIHVYYKSTFYDEYGEGGETTIKSIYNYIERNDYPDSIVYRYSLRQSNSYTGSEGSSFTFSDDVRESTIRANPTFDKLPGEPVFDENYYSYSMKNTTPLSKYDPSELESFSNVDDSCWAIIIADGCLDYDEYRKGLGGPYYSCWSNPFLEQSLENKLVYYKKGNITWGEPLVITGISDIENVNHIQVYPNPANDILNVTFESGGYTNNEIRIYSLEGKLLLSQKLLSNQTSVDISELKTGVYIVKVTNNNSGILSHLKLIVE